MVLIATGFVSAATINVPSDYSTIAAAITAASSGDTIEVAAGTYQETGLEIASSKTLTINGAGASSTIIDAAAAGRVFSILDGGTATITNLTITNGSMTGAGGAAITVGAASSLTLTNCMLSNNTVSGGDGGAVNTSTSAELNIRYCLFYNNSGTGAARGGAIGLGSGAQALISHTIFRSNLAVNSGGAIYSDTATITLARCFGYSNQAQQGGFYGTNGGSTLTVSDSTFEGNQATDSSAAGGGAILLESSDGTIRRSIFNNNTSAENAGAVAIIEVGPGSYSLTMENCLITNNETTKSNATSAVASIGVTTTITNCTFADNTDTSGFTVLISNPVTATLTNNIFYSGTGTAIIEGSAAPSVAMVNNDFYGNGNVYGYGVPPDPPTVLDIDGVNAISGSSGNIAGNPVFVGATNYHLQRTSSCINAGSSTGAPTIDLESAPRPSGSAVDIGCYEFPFTWYMAEGSTNGYDTWISVQNPNATAADIEITYMADDGDTAVISTQLAANSRLQRKINDTLDGKNGVATQVASTNDVSIIAVRSVYWPDSTTKTAGHSSIGATYPAVRWYLAEGSTDGYDTWISVQNPNDTAATLEITYMADSGTTAVITQDLAANSRLQKKINDTLDGESGIATKVEVTNGDGVIAERMMYWPDDTTKTGGHSSLGATAPAVTWYFAEGSTSGYDTWISIQNPNGIAAEVNITYMADDGTTALVTGTVAANSRLQRRINDALDGKSGVATKVESTNKITIVAERSMYWPNTTTKTDGHSSVGLAATATSWYLAEGSTRGYDTWISVQNPSVVDSTVQITYMADDGTTAVITGTVAANSRLQRKINDSLDGYNGVATQVTSTNNVDIIAVRSMYWPDDITKTGGHSSKGTW